MRERVRGVLEVPTRRDVCLVHNRCEWRAGAAVAPYSDVPLTVVPVLRRLNTPTKLQKTSGERYKVRRLE